MTSRPYPSFVGRINVGPRNNKLYFNDGSDFEVDVPNGDYWPDALASVLETLMNGVSTNFVVSFDSEKCILKFERTSGTFFLRQLLNNENNILTGGHQTFEETSFAAGQQGLNHLGLTILDQNDPASSLVETLILSNCWLPSEVIATDDDGGFMMKTVDAIAVDGTGCVYDWTPLVHDPNDPLGGGYFQQRNISFVLLDQESQDQFLLWFWSKYAGRGGIFRFYENKVNQEFVLMRFTESQRNAFQSRGQRWQQYEWYNLTLQMERARENC